MTARPISLVPATLKEASIDSPTFRGTVLHYNEQVDQVERWLDSFMKATSKLIYELSGLEDVINTFLIRAVPTNLSETIIDHDYTLVAMERYAEGSLGFWGNVITGAKRVEKTVLEPLRTFQQTELKNFKDTTRLLEATQAKYDPLLAKYLSQSKTKEPSALREDAFQVYEARKAYFRACFDFCVAAPALKSALDRVVTKVLSDMWGEQMQLRKETNVIAEKCRTDMGRIRAWSDGMESNAQAFKKQLMNARKGLEERTKKEFQPGRELEEYSVSTVPYLSKAGAAVPGTDHRKEVGSEKRGWLFMRTFTRQPTRTTWIRRWFFVKNGIFGWLVQGYRNGGVEESEKIGVLLCNVKPAVQEERRFCFEVKTKDTAVLLQAETQAELMSWLGVFEQAKRTAVESGSLDASTKAFSVIPPSAPAPNEKEPAYITKGHDGNSAGTAINTGRDSDRLPIPFPRHLRRSGDQSDSDTGQTFERSFTLGPEIGGGAVSRATSIDVSRGPATPTTPSTSASTLLSPRIDTHRKSPSSGAERSAPTSAITPTVAGGGISALIAASHTILPFQPAEPLRAPIAPINPSTLAPAALVGTPSPANLLTVTTLTTGRGALGMAPPSTITAAQNSSSSAGKGHRKAISLDYGAGSTSGTSDNEAGNGVPYPVNYPPELKLQDDHFRVLFPGVWDEYVLLVFRATWSPNEHQELAGRCYVTQKNMHFYSYANGLVFTSSTPLEAVKEVTASPEKEWDYLFLNLRPAATDLENPAESQSSAETPADRITLKIFLEPIRLLHRRLQFLVHNAAATEFDDPPHIEDSKLLGHLIQLETETSLDRSSTRSTEESWEDLGGDATAESLPRSASSPRAPKTQYQLDVSIDAEPIALSQRTSLKTEKPKLPTGPVEWSPSPDEIAKFGLELSCEREFAVPAQALFHTLFGDLSPIWHSLYVERNARNIIQGSWTKLEDGRLKRRWGYDVEWTDLWGRKRKAEVEDWQTVEKREEHVCYVVGDVKTPWHLPYRERFRLRSWVSVTFVGAARCRLSVWTGVEWRKSVPFAKRVITTAALSDLTSDALDLVDLAADNLRPILSLSHSRTKKALSLFGPVSSTPSNPLPPALPTTTTSTPRKIKRPTQRRLSQLLLDTTLSFLSTVLLSIFASLKALVSILSANRLILLALVASLVFNTLLTSRSAVSYWTERRAENILKDLDVKPNGIMTRALRSGDIESFIQNGTGLSIYPTPRNPAGACYEKFKSEALADEWYGETKPGGMLSRLREERRRLGGVRNELVVGLRLVEGLEREVVRAGWERWVVGEVGRCGNVLGVIRGAGDDMGEVRRRLGEYCGSCWEEAKGRGLGVGRMKE